jgi:ankyrin repeat protein
LLEKGAQVNVANKEGYTPLHVAADRCDPNIALALIKKGAVVNAKTNKHYTPLHFAAGMFSFKVLD